MKLLSVTDLNLSAMITLKEKMVENHLKKAEDQEIFLIPKFRTLIIKESNAKNY